MNKIQIQFKESDYKIYHDYCLRYFQVQDIVRKQSIHALLDLYEKGVIAIGEQDLRPARQFLSERCSDLKKDRNGSHDEGDSTMLLQMRVCSDLLLLLDDLEKIFRLLNKRGVVANYVMILATFSKVIDENRNSQVVDRYDLDSGMIESLARPLAEIIRLRLGTDRDWRSVVRALTYIAARFNQKYPEPKFDRDIVQLIGPAVVSHFNKDVDPREILPILSSGFEEAELEEFESLLSRTPDLLKKDQDAEINWDSLFEPLNTIAGIVAEQRGQWIKDQAKISDPFLLVPLTGTQNPDTLRSMEHGVMLSQSGVPERNAAKTFDIAVSPDFPTRMESPVETYPVPDPSPVKQKIQPFIPVIIGVAIIILFIFGTLAVSGDWSSLGLGNSTNSSNVTTTNTTPIKTATPAPKVTTKKPTATPTPKATTAKVTATPTPKSYSSTEIGNHLVDIAFGPDNSKIVKPTKDRIAISYSGSYGDNDVTLLNDFIQEFNSYSSTLKISENINYNSPADITLHFLPQEALSQVKQDGNEVISKDYQTGTYYFVKTDKETYINGDLTESSRNRWILRAILYDLGFLGESAKYSDSLFYTGSTKAERLSAIDLKALQFMYGKKITKGMTRSSVKALF